MQIKKHSSKNEYARAGDLWVRNFTKPKVVPLALDQLFDKEDYQIVIQNENKNHKHSKISDENIVFRNIVIVSDGYGFSDKQWVIQKFPPNIAILAVNGALRQWELMSAKYDDRRSINGYIVNNPYPECTRYLPRKDMRYYPTCLASKRTNHEFLERYGGEIYTFETSHTISFGKDNSEKYKIDDYRNPICAAIGLAYQFGVRKLMLFCCDDSFEKERDYAVQLKNGLWTYPQHLRSQDIIDANLYWLTHQENMPVEVSDYSSGRDYLNATYIKDEEGAIQFFEEEREELKNES